MFLPEFMGIFNIHKHINCRVPWLNHNKSSLKMPDCKYIEKIFVDFIWTNVYDKSPMQTIYCQFKKDTLQWKWLKYPPVHAANLVAHDDNSTFRVESMLYRDFVDCCGLNSGWFTHIIQGLYSLRGQISYCQILWSLEATGLDVMMIVSLWHLTGISAALLQRCLSNFRVIGKIQTQISTASRLYEIFW